MNAAKVEEIYAKFSGDATGFTDAVTKVETRAKRMADTVIKQGARMSLAFTTSLAAMSAYSVSAFSAFDEAMTNSTAIMTDLTESQRNQMSKLAQEIASKTVTSADKLAESYLFLASAGLNAEQSMAALPVVNKFAIAGNFDMAKATDLVTDAQSALGLTTKDVTKNLANMERVSNVLVKANILSNASTEQFAESLTNKAAAALRGMNKDVEEGVAVLAAYADQGMKGQIAGEQLSIVLRELQNASQKEKEAWDAMGMSIYDSEGNMKPIVDVIKLLEKATAGLSDEQKFATFTTLGFRSESMSAIKPLLGVTDAIERYEKELRSASGIVDDVANKQMQSFSAQMKIFRNQVQLVAIEIGGMLAPSLLKLNSYMAMGLDVWHGMSDEMKVVLVTSGKILAVMGPTLVTLGVFARFAPLLTAQWTAMVLNMTKAFTWIKTVGLVAALPFLKVIAIIALVTAAVVALGYAILGPEGMSNAWAKCSEFMKNFFDRAMVFLANFHANMKIAGEWLRSQWKNILTDILGGFVQLIKNMVNNQLVGIKILTRLFIAFWGWWYEHGARMFTQLAAEFIAKAWEMAKGGLSVFAEWATGVGKIMLAGVVAYALFWKEMFLAINGMLMDFAEIVADTFKKALQGEFPDPTEMLRDFAKKAQDRVHKLNNTIGTGIGKAVDAAQEGVQKAKNAILSDFALGASDENFFNTAGKIIREGMEDFKTPFEGFKFNTIAPDFILTRPAEELAKITEAATDGIDTVNAGLDETQDGAEAAAKAIDKIGKSIEAVQRGSLDAAVRIDEYFAKIREGALGAKGAAPAAAVVAGMGAGAAAAAAAAVKAKNAPKPLWDVNAIMAQNADRARQAREAVARRQQAARDAMIAQAQKRRDVAAAAAALGPEERQARRDAHRRARGMPVANDAPVIAADDPWMAKNRQGKVETEDKEANGKRDTMIDLLQGLRDDIGNKPIILQPAGLR